MKAITVKYLKTTSFLYKNRKLLKKYLKYENSVRYYNNLIANVILKCNSFNNLGAIHYHWIIEKAREFQKNIYFCFIDYTKAFVWTTKNCGKFLEMGIQTTLPASWEIYMQAKKQQLEPEMEQQSGSKSGKEYEYIKAVYCHPAYLTSMQSTSCKMLGWMKHKLE